MQKATPVESAAFCIYISSLKELRHPLNECEVLTVRKLLVLGIDTVAYLECTSVVQRVADVECEEVALLLNHCKRLY